MTSQCLHKLCRSPRQNPVIISLVYLISEMATQKLHNGSRIMRSDSWLLTHCHATKLGSSLTSARLTHWSKQTLNQREVKSNAASCTYNVTFRHVFISVFWTLNRLSYYLSQRGHIIVHIFYTYYVLLRLSLGYDVVFILKPYYLSALVFSYICRSHTTSKIQHIFVVSYVVNGAILGKHWI